MQTGQIQQEPRQIDNFIPNLAQDVTLFASIHKIAALLQTVIRIAALSECIFVPVRIAASGDRPS